MEFCVGDTVSVPPLLQDETELQTETPLMVHEEAVPAAQLQVSVEDWGGTIVGWSGMIVQSGVMTMLALSLAPLLSVQVIG